MTSLIFFVIFILMLKGKKSTKKKNKEKKQIQNKSTMKHPSIGVKKRGIHSQREEIWSLRFGGR